MNINEWKKIFDDLLSKKEKKEQLSNEESSLIKLYLKMRENIVSVGGGEGDFLLAWKSYYSSYDPGDGDYGPSTTVERTTKNLEGMIKKKIISYSSEDEVERWNGKCFFRRELSLRIGGKNIINAKGESGKVAGPIVDFADNLYRDYVGVAMEGEVADELAKVIKKDKEIEKEREKRAKEYKRQEGIVKEIKDRFFRKAG